MATPKSLTGDKQAIEEFIDKFDVFLFDCDGVLWSGDHLFEGSREVLDKLRSRGKQLVFVTNNSTKSRPDYLKKLQSMNIKANIDEIFPSSYSAAVYISRILQLPADKNKVFVLGESGIELELASEKIPYLGGTSAEFQREIGPADFKGIADGSALDPAVGVVLGGLDYHISYLKYAHAFAYLQRGARFMVTNPDSTLPNSHALFPGGGSLSAPLSMAMGGLQPMSCGKPSQAMMDAIQGKFQFDREKACMVGDRLDTDIKFGIDGGLGGTLAVLTGVSKREEWERDGAEVKPMFWVEKLSDLLG